MSAVIKTDGIIRPMSPDDLDAVMEIETGIYDFPWTRGIFYDCMRVGYECHVYEESGTVMAYSVLSHGASEAHVLTVCVAPEQQRRGLGRMMMEHMIDLARAHGVDTILLEVRPSNSGAIRLYHDLQFNQIGIRPDYYPAHDGREDAVVMARNLFPDN